MFFFMFCEIGFEPFGEFAPGKHDAPSAAPAFETDVRAEAGDGPFVGAARVLFAQAQVVVEAEVGEHGGISYQLSVAGRDEHYKMNHDKLRGEKFQDSIILNGMTSPGVEYVQT